MINKNILEICWSAEELFPQGKKQIPVKTALLQEHEHRFHLYYSGGKMISTMWTLWDEKTNIQWYLYGEGWEGAEKSAAERINEILNPKLREKRLLKRTKRKNKKG